MSTQVTSPMQLPAALASRHSSRIASAVVRTGLKTTCVGICDEAARWAAIARECSATVSSVFAFLNYHTLALDPHTPPMQPALLDKHYRRKHGATAYYGQARNVATKETKS